MARHNVSPPYQYGARQARLMVMVSGHNRASNRRAHDKSLTEALKRMLVPPAPVVMQAPPPVATEDDGPKPIQFGGKPPHIEKIPRAQNHVSGRARSNKQTRRPGKRRGK